MMKHWIVTTQEEQDTIEEIIANGAPAGDEESADILNENVDLFEHLILLRMYYIDKEYPDWTLREKLNALRTGYCLPPLE